MSKKKEQARLLRATLIACPELEPGVRQILKTVADRIDPPIGERWERVRDAGRRGDEETYWRSILAEADKGQLRGE